jgi:LacI family transcriptional regulator
MAGRRSFSMKEISRQAGLSLATIDRVLHRRGGVQIATVKRVRQALKELKAQGDLSILRGRKFTIDIVMEAPLRFSELVRKAIEAELPHLQPAQFRCRFHCFEVLDQESVISLLRKIAMRGSNGLILKVPNFENVSAAVDQLQALGIAVVTLVTDIPNSNRLAYVGIDNSAAGATAAYILGKWLPNSPASVLVNVSSTDFSGEDERQVAFRHAMNKTFPHLSPVVVSEGFGLHGRTFDLAREALQANSSILAAYSAGGANTAILEAFAKLGRACRVFIAHDLDDENRILLQREQIHAVLHHDLRADMRRCCLHILRANGVLHSEIDIAQSAIQVITPHNIPAT